MDAVAAMKLLFYNICLIIMWNTCILDKPLLTVGLGVAFSLDDTSGLNEKLSDTLEEMQKDGTSEKIIGKYLAHPSTYLEVENYEVK